MLVVRPHRQEEGALVPAEPGVYAFVCNADRAIYIGATGHMRRRFMSWRGVLHRSNRSTRILMRQAAISPWDGWLFVVLYSDPAASRAFLLNMERDLIKLAGKLPGYRLLNTQHK